MEGRNGGQPVAHQFAVDWHARGLARPSNEISEGRSVRAGHAKFQGDFHDGLKGDRCRAMTWQGERIARAASRVRGVLRRGHKASLSHMVTLRKSRHKRGGFAGMSVSFVVPRNIEVDFGYFEQGGQTVRRGRARDRADRSGVELASRPLLDSCRVVPREICASLALLDRSREWITMKSCIDLERGKTRRIRLFELGIAPRAIRPGG